MSEMASHSIEARANAASLRVRHDGAGHFVEWASGAADVRAAQRLRYRVFSDELGARLRTPLAGHDVDAYDAWCDHLLVRQGPGGEVIGTYRVLPPEQAAAAGGLYCDGEFRLDALDALRPRLLELGRACVDRRYRQGGVILALWSALADYMRERHLDLAIGCASVPIQDGGIDAAGLWHGLKGAYLSPTYRVTPLVPLPVDLPAHRIAGVVPPLLGAYLRIGAKLLGPPAWDPAFRCADLPVMLQLDDLPARHARHFIGDITSFARAS